MPARVLTARRLRHGSAARHGAWLGLAGLVLALACGCYDPDLSGTACSNLGECPSGYRCDPSTTTCVSTNAPVDASLAPDSPSPVDGRADAHSSADSGPIPPGTLFCVYASAEPVFDGDAAEWDGAVWEHLDIAEAAQRTQVHESYANTASADFACMHDAVNLYFFVAVTDDSLVSDSYDIYEDDAVLLFIDAAGDRSGPFSTDDHYVAVGQDNTYSDYAAPEASAITLGGIVLSTAVGYSIEIRIRKNTLGAGTVGPELGFDLAISDDDGLGDQAADCHGLWFVQDVAHCGTCCPAAPEPSCDTTLFGRLVLAAEGG